MLTTALLSLVVTGAPSVAQAEALAAKADGETLFLQFGALKPDDCPAPDRARLARALLKGAAASRKDPVIALGLAERALLFARNPEGLLLLAQIEIDLGQRSGAAGHLDEALAQRPNDLGALEARASLADAEHEPKLAVELYERAVAAGGKADLKARLEKARKALAVDRAAVDDLKTTEASIKRRVAEGARNAARSWIALLDAEHERNAERRRMAPDGVRQAEVRNFTFSYSAGNQDSRQMHAFEDRLEQLLEKTYDFVAEKLGHRVEKRTEVLLLTHPEFLARFGGTPTERAAGFWNGKQIVINGGSVIDERFARVLVHEFTHTAVHDIARGRGDVPRWLNEGLAVNIELCAAGLNGKPEPHDRMLLGQLAKSGRLPGVSELDQSLVAFGEGVQISYLVAGELVRLLVDQRGYATFVDMLRDLGKGRPAKEIVERHFEPLEKLEQRLRDELT
jgi:tetratricopeptide (TPR) repeat protein